AQRDAGRRKGGKDRMRRAAGLAGNEPHAPPAKVPAVAAPLGLAIKPTRKGALAPQGCNAGGEGGGGLLRGLGGDELARQVAELRADIERMKVVHGGNRGDAGPGAATPEGGDGPDAGRGGEPAPRRAAGEPGCDPGPWGAAGGPLAGGGAVILFPADPA